MSNGINKTIKRREEKEAKYIQCCKDYLEAHMRNKNFRYNKITLAINKLWC